MSDVDRRDAKGNLIELFGRRRETDAGDALSTMEKHYLLARILSGAQSMNAPIARLALAQLLDSGPGALRVLLLTIDGFRGFCEQCAPEGPEAAMEHVMGIAREHCARAFAAEAVRGDQRDRFALILKSRGDLWEPHTEHQWSVWFDSLHQLVESRTGVSVSVIISGEGDELSALPGLYRQAHSATIHQIFYAAHSMLFSETIASFLDKYYVYPVKEEEWMIRAIMRGNPDKAKALLRETILGAREYSPTVISMTIYRLAIALSDIIDELQKGGFLAFPIQVPRSVLGSLNLPEFESIEEIIDIFSSTIQTIVDSLDSKRDDRHEEILATIRTYIEEHFSERDCCMETAAELVGLSAAYVGRLYKRHMLKSIAESILEIRICHAKDMLLADRKYTVAQIASANGFSDVSYFCKVFRKTCGVTPSEYRNAAPQAAGFV